MNFIPQKSLSIGFAKRFNEYLKNPNRIDQKKIIDDLCLISQPLLFGGIVRDFLLNSGFLKFRSDIDIVLYNCKKTRLLSLANQHKWAINKFGGFRAITKTGHLDIWRIEDTWAFKNEYVHLEDKESILETTFFNIDSIYYDLIDEEVNFSTNFELGVKAMTLDFILPQNPNQISCINRAFKYAQNKNFTWSNSLIKHFIIICNSHANLYGGNTYIYKRKSALQLAKTLEEHLNESKPFPPEVGIQLGFKFDII